MTREGGRAVWCAGILLAAGLGACGGSSNPGPAVFPSDLTAWPQARKARFFFDSSLSASGRPSWGTCPGFAAGNAQTLTANEIDRVVAFPCTRTGGHGPHSPAACNVPAQCAPSAR